MIPVLRFTAITIDWLFTIAMSEIVANSCVLNANCFNYFLLYYMALLLLLLLLMVMSSGHDKYENCILTMIVLLYSKHDRHKCNWSWYFSIWKLKWLRHPPTPAGRWWWWSVTHSGSAALSKSVTLFLTSWFGLGMSFMSVDHSPHHGQLLLLVGDGPVEIPRRVMIFICRAAGRR